MDVSEALKSVGEYGKVQKYVFWSMAIPQLFIAWNHMLNVFVGATPEFVCQVDGSQPVKGCTADSVRSPCRGYTFDEADFTSIASEWDLVCGEAYKTDLAQSLYMVGLLMGNFIGGYVADNHGRKSVCYVGAFGTFFFGVLAIRAATFAQYILIRYVAALCAGAYGLVSFTLPAEMVGSSYRGYINVVTSITFAVGISTLPLLAYFVRDWRMLSVVTAAPGLIGVAYFFLLPESPRWLVTQGRIKEAEKVLAYMWEENKSPAIFLCSDEAKEVPAMGSDSTAALVDGPGLEGPVPIRLKVVQKERTGQSGIRDIVFNVRFLTMTAINVLTWFVSSMTYYGLNFKMGDLNGNKYVNVVLSGLVEIPACLLTLYFMDKHGRRITFTGTLLASAVVCLFITVLPPVAGPLSTFLALLGKTAISMAMCVCWMHAAEMYPTNIRNKAMSFCSMSGRFGGVVAPMVLALGRTHAGVDFLLFGVMASLATVVSSRLPETLNRSLPDSMEDLEAEAHGERVERAEEEIEEI